MLIISILFILLGAFLLIFNEKAVFIETKLKRRNIENFNKKLVKAQFYIIGGFLTFIGLFGIFMNR